MSDAARALGALRRLAPAVYAVAALLIVVPLVDFVTSSYPFIVGDPRWRFATVGLFAGFLMTPLLGVVLAMLTAAALQQAGVLRAFAWACLLAALLLVALSGSLVLDVLQVRAGAPADAAQAVLLSGIRGVVKHLTAAVAFVMLFLGGRQAADAVPLARGKERLDPIVGAARGTAAA